MTVIELKEKLIAQVNAVDDEAMLAHMSDLFAFESKTNKFFEMSQGEIDAVEEGLAQLRNGEGISHKEANRQIDEWLRK